MLDIRITMLKYIRFLDLKQLENKKLCELMTAIEDSLLPANTLRKDHCSDILNFPTHHGSESVPEAIINTELPLHTSYIIPRHDDDSTQIKQTITKLKDQNIASKIDHTLK